MYDTASVTSITDSKSQSMSQATGTRKADAPDEGKQAEKKPESKVSAEEVKSSVSELNNALKSLNVKREFSVAEETDDVVVKIIDSEDKSVIRQIPNEEAVKLSQNIKEMVGLLYDSVS